MTRSFSDSTLGFTRTDDEFIEAATSALRSVLEKISDVKTEVLILRWLCPEGMAYGIYPTTIILQ